MADVPIMVPKTDADVEMLVAATLEWAASTGTPVKEAEVRNFVNVCRILKAEYYRPFTDDEMRRSCRGVVS